MTKKILFTFLIALGAVNSYAESDAGNDNWHRVTASQVASSGIQKIHPDRYDTYELNAGNFKLMLNALPTDPAAARSIELPMPGGKYRNFKVWQTPAMEAGLARRYPQITTYTAVATDDKHVTAKLDFTVFGFHAYVFDGDNTYLIDPFSNANDGFYMCYYKRDCRRAENDKMPCLVGDVREDELGIQRMNITSTGLPNTPLKVNGTTKRTYRLALACTIEYAAAVAGISATKPAVLSAMVTSMNRVNGVYERELAITMVLVANDDTLIYLSGTDPYSNNSGTTMLSENQANVDNIIGPLNYDIGHVFSTAGGGIADLGCVCDFGTKARGVTGQSNPIGDAFDIDYVAHEMGHQFGATHTFNANINAGSCTGNAASGAAYEPGSGSTIMAYAGICGSANNIQAHSDDYFHAKSLDQITNKITSVTCASNTLTNNNPPVEPPFTTSYNIPFLTPFELTAPDATDTDHDLLNYCWEEYDLGDFGQRYADTIKFGPLFRSFKPGTSTTRVFPTLDKLVANVTSYTGEKLPAVARDMKFRLTVRDMFNGIGSFNFPTDEIDLHVINTTVPFTVSAPNAATDYWQIGSTVTVQWDVANTTAAPISCANVDIFLSTDDGYTYPFTLATGTPNDGSETITVPFAPTTSARVKVKGSGNVFFDISNKGFTINTWPASVANIEAGEVRMFPNPASGILNLALHKDDAYRAVIVNTLGQSVWQNDIAQSAAISVKGWASGMYMLHLVNKATNQKTVHRFIVE